MTTLAKGHLALRRQQLREGVAEQIAETGLRVYSFVPRKFVPAAVVIAPGDPYLTRLGANYGCEFMNLSAVAIGGKGMNDVGADELDELIETVLDALYALEGRPGFESMAVGDVGDPGPISPNGQGPFLSAPIGVRIEINRKEQR